MQFYVMTRTHVRQFTHMHVAKCRSTISWIMSSYFPVTGVKEATVRASTGAIDTTVPLPDGAKLVWCIYFSILKAVKLMYISLHVYICHRACWVYYQLGMHRSGFFRFGRTGPNQAASRTEQNRTEPNRITFIYCRSFRVMSNKLLIFIHIWVIVINCIGRY